MIVTLSPHVDGGAIENTTVTLALCSMLYPVFCPSDKNLTNSVTVASGPAVVSAHTPVFCPSDANVTISEVVTVASGLAVVSAHAGVNVHQLGVMCRGSKCPLRPVNGDMEPVRSTHLTVVSGNRDAQPSAVPLFDRFTTCVPPTDRPSRRAVRVPTMACPSSFSSTNGPELTTGSDMKGHYPWRSPCRRVTQSSTAGLTVRKINQFCTTGLVKGLTELTPRRSGRDSGLMWPGWTDPFRGAGSPYTAEPSSRCHLGLPPNSGENAVTLIPQPQGRRDGPRPTLLITLGVAPVVWRASLLTLMGPDTTVLRGDDELLPGDSKEPHPPVPTLLPGRVPGTMVRSTTPLRIELQDRQPVLSSMTSPDSDCPPALRMPCGGKVLSKEKSGAGRRNPSTCDQDGPVLDLWVTTLKGHLGLLLRSGDYKLNFVAVQISEQDNLVSPPWYLQPQLFSFPTDSVVIDLLWLTRTLTSSSFTLPDQEAKRPPPRALRHSSPITTLTRLAADSSTPPRPSRPSHESSLGSNVTNSALTSWEKMRLPVALCLLLLEFAIVTADRLLLRNGYGTVEARYRLTAYDCSDPAEVQAYSSIPASHCSTRATPVQKDQPTRFQLLQKERKRYINAYVCSLFRTDIRYNCGVYGHPELDPMHWSFLIPQRVTVEQCLEWLRTRTYKPDYHSTMMHGKEFSQPVLVDEPNYVTYLVYGRTFLQGPAIPTDQVTDIACQGEWYEYQPDKPLNHIVAFYDELHLQTVTLVIEDDKVIDKDRQLSLPCPWNDGHCQAEGLTYLWNVTGPEYCPVAVVKEFLGHRLHANVSNPGGSYGSHHAEAIVSAKAEEKIRIQPTGPVSQCGRVVTSTNIEDMFLFPILETDDDGRVRTDNRDQVFERRIHPGEVDLRKYIANRDEYLYYDITSQAEREFDAILHQDCLRRQDEARKAHFFEHGLPGYQPYLLQDGAFSTRSGETNYRYQCLPRTVHPVSASRCYNKLPVVLRLPQHLSTGAVLNFSDSQTYFLDPDSRLLSPIASEVPCSALFPAVYQTHQGWIAVTPDIHQAPSPQPLPVPPPHRTEGVFREPDYNEGGLYQSDTLEAMQDFLLTPLLREAVTYKLAHQIHNLRPENEYILGPLDVFPTDAAAAADWRNLLFGGWWSWLEKWGKVASICIGAYYLYVAARWILTTIFSLKVLYEEHGFGPNLLWGLGPGQGVFPMRFYRRWRRFKQHLSQTGRSDDLQPPSPPLPHEYLTMEEVRTPTLPQRNSARPGVSPELPPSNSETNKLKELPQDHYSKPERRTERPPQCHSESDSEVSPPSTPGPAPAVPVVRLERMVPPTTTPSTESGGLVGLPNPRGNGAPRPMEDTFPKGPLGEAMRPRS